MMGFYVSMIAFDRIISTESRPNATYNTNLNYKTLTARIRADQIEPADIQVNVN